MWGLKRDNVQFTEKRTQNRPWWLPSPALHFFQDISCKRHLLIFSYFLEVSGSGTITCSVSFLTIQPTIFFTLSKTTGVPSQWCHGSQTVYCLKPLPKQIIKTGLIGGGGEGRGEEKGGGEGEEAGGQLLSFKLEIRNYFDFEVLIFQIKFYYFILELNLMGMKFTLICQNLVI